MVNSIPPISPEIRNTLLVIYCILLFVTLIIWVLFVIFQNRWNLTERRIEQVGSWFNSLLMILLGYMAGILTG